MKHADPHFSSASLPKESLDSVAAAKAKAKAEQDELMIELGAALQAGSTAAKDLGKLRTLQEDKKRADAKMAASRRTKANKPQK